jgi:hypothetical protein
LFPTIDDAREKAQELATILDELSKFKYPLDVRRGFRKGVKKNMNDEKWVKASSRTYFLDIKKTKEGKPYLRITESRKGEEKRFNRNSINVFPEDADRFLEAVSQMTEQLGQTNK